MSLFCCGKMNLRDIFYTHRSVTAAFQLSNVTYLGSSWFNLDIKSVQESFKSVPWQKPRPRSFSLVSKWNLCWWRFLFGAFQVLEACMNNCGKRFHGEVAKFRFLNELIKVLTPKVMMKTKGSARVWGIHQNFDCFTCVISRSLLWRLTKQPLKLYVNCCASGR